MKILVLAGGYDQIALIKELKRRGHQVLLADYFEDPPARFFADHHYQISTLDEDAIYALAKREAVDLVTTACTDQALLTAANVSEKMGTPFYVSSETALDLTNKYYMKMKMTANDIPTAGYEIFDGQSDWASRKGKIDGFPLVVKPCDCNSSKGIVRVDNREELDSAVEDAFRLSRSKKVIVEEYIEGEEISIDVWIDDEGEKILSVSKTSKMTENEAAFTIYQSRYPYSGIDAIQDEIRDVVQKIAKGFQLSNCPLLVQALVREGKISVIEFSARMGGGTKYKLIEYMSGIHIMEKYVNRILGDTSQTLHPVWSKRCVELNYVYAHNGTITEITGLEALKEQGIIEDFFLYQSIGSTIRKRTTSSDRVFGFLITGDSEEQLQAIRKDVFAKVDILDGDRSILYRCNYQ